MITNFSTTHSISAEDDLIQYFNIKQVNSNKFSNVTKPRTENIFEGVD